MRRSMTLAEVEAARERWLRRLLRAANAVEVYNKAYKRIAARQILDARRTAAPTPAYSSPTDPDPVPPIVRQAVEVVSEPADELGIPAFLQRERNPADEAAKAEILAQQEAAKKEKTAARIAKLKASKAGELKKMPLQGKAALAAIKGE